MESDARAMAQELIYDAWELPSEKKRIELAGKALELWPDCADAYVILGEDKAANIEQVLDYYQKGVRAGERALGRKGFREYAGHFWGFLETRPYMRARARLADTLLLLGRKDEAARHFSEMLTLNPGDNQGVRYELAALLLELDRDEELEELLVQYEEDGSAGLSYMRALSAFRREGDSPGSRSLLADALESNPHVPEYMLAQKKLPRRLPVAIGFGDESEAISCVYTYQLGWARTDGALEWLGKWEQELTGLKYPDGGMNRKIGRNEPLEDFSELSPAQVGRLLHGAWDPDSPVVFRTDTAIPAEVPFLRLFMPLIRELGQGPLKETVTGNLPRKTVRAVALSFFGDEYLTDRRFRSGFRGESDFQSLHIVRLIAGMGGFIKKRYQRFSLTKRGESVLAEGVSGETFLRLLETYAGKFNWGYRDRFEDLPIVQMSALFSLYLLQKFGDENRPLSFYEEKFLNAFPVAVEGVMGHEYWSREDMVGNCFTFRSMDRFAHFFGFMEYVDKGSKYMFQKERVVRKTPFLDDWISFQMD